jgi:hypothetical protein
LAFKTDVYFDIDSMEIPRSYAYRLRMGCIFEIKERGKKNITAELQTAFGEVS